MHAVDLAASTGLRLGDLVRLSWSHIGDDSIVVATGKSRGRREAIIPLYDGLRDVLARIPKVSTTVLTSAARRPWTPNALSAAFMRAKKAAGLTDRDLHFHDLRGTAATRFYVAGLPVRVIAEILAWSRGPGRPDHPPLRGPGGGHQGGHPAAERHRARTSGEQRTVKPGVKLRPDSG